MPRKGPVKPFDQRKHKSPHCMQCVAINLSNGQRCKRSTCIVGPYCTFHMKQRLCLEIRNSKAIKWPGEKGLFAVKSRQCPGSIIFKPGDKICNYYEEVPIMGKNDKGEDEIIGYNYPYAKRRSKVSDATYVLGVNNSTLADASVPTSTPARYANDCRGTSYECNAKISVDNVRKTAKLVATTKIYDGDEILWHYGPSYWKGYKGNPKQPENEQEEF